MSSYGDFCREQRQARQRVRMFWHECPTCAVAYGTGTSVAPGGKCRNCGWSAPGKPMDDMKAADDLDRKRMKERLAKKAKREANFTIECPYCDRKFGSKQARGTHVNKLHEKQHLAERRKLT